MTKKTYILTLLTKLSGQWAYADGLKALVEQTDVQDSVINGIVEWIITQSMKQTLSHLEQERMNKAMIAVQKIKELHHDFTDESLDNILSQI